MGNAVQMRICTRDVEAQSKVNENAVCLFIDVRISS